MVYIWPLMSPRPSYKPFMIQPCSPLQLVFSSFTSSSLHVYVCVCV